MDIVRIGNFALCYSVYLCEHEYTTHDIEICKYTLVDKSRYAEPETVDDESKFTIASFKRNNKDPEESDLVSCGLRLIEALETEEDIKAVQKLADIGLTILKEEPRKIDIGEKDHKIKSWRWDPADNLLHYQGEN